MKRRQNSLVKLIIEEDLKLLKQHYPETYPMSRRERRAAKRAAKKEQRNGERD